MVTSLMGDGSFSPHSLFFAFLEAIHFSAAPLVEFLTSRETNFLAYFLAYMRFAEQRPSKHFAQVAPSAAFDAAAAAHDAVISAPSTQVGTAAATGAPLPPSSLQLPLPGTNRKRILTEAALCMLFLSHNMQAKFLFLLSIDAEPGSTGGPGGISRSTQLGECLRSVFSAVSALQTEGRMPYNAGALLARLNRFCSACDS